MGRATREKIQMHVMKYHYSPKSAVKSAVMKYQKRQVFTKNPALLRGGGKGIRTPDLRIANATLYQLSHTPTSGTIEIIAYPEPDCKYVFGFDLKKLAGVKNSAGGTIAMNPKRR